jgi:alpha-1,2-mannosyltransferase
MRVRRLIGWPDPKALAVSCLIGAFLLAYCFLLLLPVFASATPRADDFQDYLWAARQIAIGGDPYGDFVRTHVPWDWSLSSGYLYPPVFAAILIPLTWLPNDLAVRIWILVVQAAVVGSVLIIYRQIGQPRRAEVLALVAVLATFFPLINTIWTGAMNALLLLLLTAAFAAWRRHRDSIGGFAIGLAALFKVFPVALLPYFAWRRDWRLVVASLVTGTAGLLACLAVTGLAHNIFYFTQLLPHLAVGSGYRENQSLAGLAARLCDPSTADHGGGAGWCGRLVDWPAMGAVLATVVYAVRRGTRSPMEYGLALAALPLISSVTWSFHLVILIFPMVLLIRTVFEGTASRTQVRRLLAAWICFSAGPAAHYALIFAPFPHLAGVLNLIPVTVTWLAAQAYLIGTGLVFACALIAVRGEDRAGSLPRRLAA